MKNVGYSLELFGKNKQSKKLISYATSFGNTTLSKLAEHNKKKEIGECLKKFVTIVRKSEGDSYGNEEKLIDVLNRLGLIERSTQDVCEIDKILEDTIEYEKVESIIKEERLRTYKYLECALIN